MNRAIERLAEELGNLSAEEWTAVAGRHRRLDDQPEAASSEHLNDAGDGGGSFGKSGAQEGSP